MLWSWMLAGASCCTPLASSVVVGGVAAVGDAAAAAVHAATGAKGLDVEVAVAVVAAASVVAAVATAYLEVLDQASRDVEAETKVGTAKPGGKRGRSP